MDRLKKLNINKEELKELERRIKAQAIIENTTAEAIITKVFTKLGVK